MKKSILLIISAVALVQAIHVQHVISKASHFDGTGATIHGWVIAIIIELAIIALAWFKQTRAFTFVVLISTVITASYFFPNPAALNLNDFHRLATGIFALTFPFINIILVNLMRDLAHREPRRATEIYHSVNLNGSLVPPLSGRDNSVILNEPTQATVNGSSEFKGYPAHLTSVKDKAVYLVTELNLPSRIAASMLGISKSTVNRYVESY